MSSFVYYFSFFHKWAQSLHQEDLALKFPCRSPIKPKTRRQGSRYSPVEINQKARSWPGLVLSPKFWTLVPNHWLGSHLVERLAEQGGSIIRSIKLGPGPPSLAHFELFLSKPVPEKMPRQKQCSSDPISGTKPWINYAPIDVIDPDLSRDLGSISLSHSPKR